MFTKNLIQLTGNITKAPETRKAGETTVTRARLIHNETIRKADGETVERVVAVDLDIWGKRGEAFAEHISSKTPVYVEGRLQLDQWEQDGQLDGHDNDDWGTVVGLRNAHDKRFPAALAMGNAVFICDNLAISGEVVLARRHTTNILRDLPQLTTRAVGKLGEFIGVAERRAASYRECDLGNAEAHDLIVRALDARAITTTMVPKVLAQWRAPYHPEFRDRNLWSLYNAFTETLKGGLLKLPQRSEALHGVLDTTASIERRRQKDLALPA